MRILIDTNRIIAALTKQGTTRDILFSEMFEFITPDYTLNEVNKHRNEIRQKTRLTDAEFEVLLALIFERITIIPESEYRGFIEECKRYMSDLDDVPHLATCLACKAEGIWAHDPHFLEQRKVKVLTNIDMLRLSGKAK